jgi:hypothetical protein
MSGSDAIQRDINPLITTESSTTITRNGSCRHEAGVEELVNATLITHQVRLKIGTFTGGAEVSSAAGRNSQT